MDKEIIGAKSLFFQAYFSIQLDEYRVQKFSSAQFNDFLDLLSGNHVILNEDRAMDMMITADFFLAPEVNKKCTDFLIQLVREDPDAKERLQSFAKEYLFLDLEMQLQNIFSMNLWCHLNSNYKNQ